MTMGNSGISENCKRAAEVFFPLDLRNDHVIIVHSIVILFITMKYSFIKLVHIIIIIKCICCHATEECVAYHTGSIKQMKMCGNRSTSSSDVRSFYCQLPSVTSCHCSAMSVIMICCRRWYYKEQRMVIVTEKDLINHGRTTARNGKASRCHHCCAPQMTEVDRQSSQWMHLSEYLNDAWTLWVLVGRLYADCVES